MLTVEKKYLLPEIGSYSEHNNATLKDYSFSSAKNVFVRPLSELPFALGSILHSNPIGSSRDDKVNFIGRLAERIVGEWLKKYAEYSFQPEAHYLYQSRSGKNTKINARANDFTILDDGSIFNAEVKFIIGGGTQRRSRRLLSATEQLKSTAAILEHLSDTHYPGFPALKPENVIIVIRSAECKRQGNSDETISRAERLYRILLATARNPDQTEYIPKMILSFKDLKSIFNNLYPDHKATKDFVVDESCFAELRSFSAIDS